MVIPVGLYTYHLITLPHVCVHHSIMHRCGGRVREAGGGCARRRQPEGAVPPLDANTRWGKASSCQPACSGVARSQEDPLRFCSIVSNQQPSSDPVVMFHTGDELSFISRLIFFLSSASYMINNVPKGSLEGSIVCIAIFVAMCVSRPAVRSLVAVFFSY